MTERRLWVEVSAGELLDKITILEIKAARIADATKLAHVREELRVLSEEKARALPSTPALEAMVDDLRATNQALWAIEDRLRACEAAGDFGPAFIELARSVYFENDRRAALKKRINALVGSRLVEEKAYVPYGGGPALH